MQEEARDPLKDIIYISVPESFTGTVGDVTLDTSVLLPVETREGPEHWNPEELSWEMIIAGMLKVLAYQPDHDDAPYYRAFIRAMRPRMVEELSETGIINSRNENFEIAEEIFLALSGFDPAGVEGPANLAVTLEQRAEALEKIGRTEEADRCRDRAAAAYRSLFTRSGGLPADVYLNGGLFFLKAYNMEEARRCLEQFVQLSEEEDKVSRARSILSEIESQNTTDQLFKEAFDFIRMGDEERGIAAVEAFLGKHPDAWNGWFLLGWGNRRLNRFQDAARAFERALSLGGDNADTRNELAICQMELGNFKASRRHLEQALKLEPDNTKIMSNMGVLALKEDDPEEARRYFDAVLELEPEDPVAQRYRDHLNGL